MFRVYRHIQADTKTVSKCALDGDN
ncbi:hypothetical protein MASSI9I_51119 [Massilia sp. 9I]|nr:hypothetical protein MASSI9I_51119 [Massilia sp. 9I]